MMLLVAIVLNMKVKEIVKEIRTKLYQLKKEYLNMISTYLRDTINDHEIQGEWKVHSGNTLIDYKSQGELKS